MFDAIPDWKMCISTIKTLTGAAWHELLKSSVVQQASKFPTPHPVTMGRSWFVSLWCFSSMCTPIWREELKRSGQHFRLFIIAPLVNWMLLKVWTVHVHEVCLNCVVYLKEQYGRNALNGILKMAPDVLPDTLLALNLILFAFNTCRSAASSIGV